MSKTDSTECKHKFRAMKTLNEWYCKKCKRVYIIIEKLVEIKA